MPSVSSSVPVSSSLSDSVSSSVSPLTELGKRTRSIQPEPSNTQSSAAVTSNPPSSSSSSSSSSPPSSSEFPPNSSADVVSSVSKRARLDSHPSPPVHSSSFPVSIPSTFHLLDPIQANFNQLLMILHDTQRRFIDYTHAQALKESTEADERKALEIRKQEVEAMREFVRRQSDGAGAHPDEAARSGSDSVSVSVASLFARIAKLESALSEKESELSVFRASSLQENQSLRQKVNDLELAFKDAEAKLQYANLELRTERIKSNQYAVEVNLRAAKMTTLQEKLDKYLLAEKQSKAASPTPINPSSNQGQNQNQRSPPANAALPVPGRPPTLSVTSPSLPSRVLSPSNASFPGARNAASVLREHQLKKQKSAAAAAARTQAQSESVLPSVPVPPQIPKLSVEVPPVASESSSAELQSPPSPYLQYLKEKTSKSSAESKEKERGKDKFKPSMTVEDKRE